VCTLLLCTATAYAKKETFVREYRYTAGDEDSKNSAKERAATELKKELLREIGEVIIARSKNIDGEYSERIENIVAGKTKMKITDEEWTGKTYWMKAEVTVDPDDVTRQLEELRQDKKKEQEMEQKLQAEQHRREEAERRLAAAEREVERSRQAANANRNDAAASKRYEESQKDYRQAVTETSKAQGVKTKTSEAYIDLIYSGAGVWGFSIGGRRISNRTGWYFRGKIRSRSEEDFTDDRVLDLSSLKKDDRSIHRLAFTVGPYVRLWDWCALYGGLGYGDYAVGYSTGEHYTETSKDKDGKETTKEMTIFYAPAADKRQGLEVEAGVMIKIRSFSLSVGYATIVNKSSPIFGNKESPMFGDIVFGVGFRF
jgi:opacity protein-like surface antigen